MKPGDLQTVKIDSFTKGGVKVKLICGIYAYIQNIHLTEVPLKNPEKKFKVGDPLKCRVC